MNSKNSISPGGLRESKDSEAVTLLSANPSAHLTGRSSVPNQPMKRFTGTEVWQKPWFRKSSCRLKCLWKYLCDHCDPAGVWEPDWDLASFYIGEPVQESDISAFNGNAVMRNQNVFLPQFVEFQYGTLSQDCKPHLKVFEAMEHHGLSLSDVLPKGNATLKDRVCNTLQEEEEEKEEDKEKDKDKDKSQKRKKFIKPTIEELALQAAKIGLPESEIAKFMNYYESNGWRVGKNPMQSWPHALQTWKLNYESGRYQSSFGPNRTQPDGAADRNRHLAGTNDEYIKAGLKL